MTHVAPRDEPVSNREDWLDAALLEWSDSHDSHTRDRIMTNCDWLAVRAARRFCDRGEPYEDLLQVARMGLLKALERFDLSQQVPFGAYATPSIVGELKRYFRDHTWRVHVGRRAKDLQPALAATTEYLSASLGRSPRISELAAELHVDQDLIIEAVEATSAYRTQPLAETSTTARVPTEEFDDEVVDHEAVLALLATLDPIDRQILRLRFFGELTQTQIAEHIGSSQVHVGRRIARALLELQARFQADERKALDSHTGCGA